MKTQKLANKKIKIIQGISGVFHTPYIIEGKFSKSGKTITVTPKYKEGKKVRLNTEKFLKRKFDSRNSTTFKPYTKEDFVKSKKANYDRANQRNLETIEKEELPEQYKEVINIINELK